MAKDPAVLLYTGDFLVGAEHLTDAETGQYVRLLCYQHQKGHLTKEFMHRICRGIPSAMLLEKFTIDENGLFYNKRMEVEIEKRANFSISQKLKANKRWDK